MTWWEILLPYAVFAAAMAVGFWLLFRGVSGWQRRQRGQRRGGKRFP